MSRRMSDEMKRRWADPVWAAKQRRRIAEGMLASDLVAIAAKARCQRCRDIEEHRELQAAYDPVRDNPRMRKLLGSM